MAERYTLVFKSGHQMQLVDKSGGGHMTQVLSEYEKYLKDGNQKTYRFSFRDRNDNVANPNIRACIDFREVSSIIQHDI